MNPLEHRYHLRDLERDALRALERRDPDTRRSRARAILTAIGVGAAALPVLALVFLAL